jgi:hypothetical protein
MKPRFKDFIISTIVSLVIIVSFAFFAGGSVYLMVIIGHYLLLILAGLFLALRYSNFIYREQFFYILIGSFNLSLGLHAFAVYLLGYVIVNYPEMMSANLAVGTLMLIDALVLRRKTYE